MESSRIVHRASAHHGVVIIISMAVVNNNNNHHSHGRVGRGQLVSVARRLRVDRQAPRPDWHQQATACIDYMD